MVFLSILCLVNTTQPTTIASLYSTLLWCNLALANMNKLAMTVIMITSQILAMISPIAMVRFHFVMWTNKFCGHVLAVLK